MRKKIKRFLFKVMWKWKNRTWKECRHKRRRLNDAIRKREKWW